MDSELRVDFSQLLYMNKSSLLAELTDTHQSLANLHNEIAFLRTEELRQVDFAKTQRIIYEGERDAYMEKKWLIIKLLESKE